MGGSDIAIASVDVIVLRDDVSAVLTAQQISRASYRRVRRNVAVAFLFSYDCDVELLVAESRLLGAGHALCDIAQQLLDLRAGWVDHHAAWQRSRGSTTFRARPPPPLP